MESVDEPQPEHDPGQPHAAASSCSFYDDEALDVSEGDEDEDRISRELVGSSFRRREVPPPTTSSTTSSFVKGFWIPFIPDVPSQ